MALRLLLAMLTATGAAGDCGRPPELENGSPIDESVSEMAFEVGSVINYRCDLGYVFKEDSLLGSRSVTCNEDSAWTPLEVKCEVKNCGNPGEIIHGYSWAPNTTFGSKAVFYCDSGYMLVGRNYQLCTADGWSGQIPACEAVTCANLPPIRNGETPSPPYGEYWEYGMVAKYSCDKKYSLIGAERLVCTETGEWNNPPPKCKAVLCHPPNLPENGQIEAGFGPTYIYGETISYSCVEGFQMVGDSVIECGENNTFVPGPPSCKPITCADLPLINNSLAPSPPYGQHWEYRMVAKFSCSAGYSLIGAAKLVCTETGEWNNVPPECKAVLCHPPDLPADGQIEAGFGPMYSYGETISYSCAEGFQMVGESVIECRGNNTFVPEPPSCTPIQCHRPEQIAGGQIEAGFGPTYSYGETISYSCDEGFQMVGGSVIECRGNNTFVPEPPSCTLRNCSNPEEIANGYIQAPNTTFGSRATFSCKTGYQLVGSSYLLCAAAGWDGQMPTCEAVRCAPLPPINNGIAPSPPRGEQWEYGAVAAYSCDAGYSLQGAVNLTCRENGEWKWAPPMCIAKNCGYPGEIVNGYSLAANTTFGSRAIFYCKKGFLMVGKNYRVCTTTGWDGKVPVCKEIKSTPVKIAEFAEPRLKFSQVAAQKKSGLETAGIIIVCIIIFCFAVGVIAGLFQYKKRCWLSRQYKTRKNIRIKPQPSQSKGEAHFDGYSDHPA
ncbi:C4b-binding protein alpha chain-like [Hemitrygon akajei]|uniref:C4b-binding protein alpha chain-like n=1 Tax=Hemitrygon akajei TaxID=2704970 RepID=UPI003BF977DB